MTISAFGTSATRGIRDPLAGIRPRFLALVETYAIEVELLREDAADPAQAAEVISELASIAHRVAGVAATLGFAPLGDVAARLDGTLTRAKLNGNLDLTNHDALIGQFHTALNDAVAQGAC